MRVVCLADDLSGASEAAAALGAIPTFESCRPVAEQRGLDTTVHVVPPRGHLTWQAITVVNTDNRHVGATTAVERLEEILASDLVAPDSMLFLKFDSLLRGSIAEQLVVVGRRAPIFFCPAVPELARTVRNGVIEVNGQSLHETQLWIAESEGPATTVTEQLSAAQTAHMTLNDVRLPHAEEVFARFAADADIIICDAETPHDLDCIAAGALSSGAILAGAAGLANALRRQLGVSEGSARPLGSSPRREDILIVLGTASVAARKQVRRLEEAGICVYRLHPEEIDDFDLPSRGTVAVIVDADVDPAISRTLTASLTAMVHRRHGGRHLVLSGGETAQAVLRDLEIVEFTPLIQAHAGAVVGLAPDGRLVATRPGSYGSETSLLEILSTMHALQGSDRKVFP